MLLGLWSSCLGWGGVTPHPAPLAAAPAAQRLALVGATSSPPPVGMLADMAEASLDGVVLVGDAVEHSHPAHWARVVDRWRSLPVLDVVGGGERLGDPGLRGHQLAFGGQPTWGQAAVGMHRLVWLDASDPVDQRFWLPKALRPRDGGLVVVLGEPGPEVEEQVLGTAEPTQLAVVVHGGAAGNAASLPHGRWNLMEVGVGPTEGGRLEPGGGRAAFHRALREALATDLPASEWAVAETSPLQGALHPGGWWLLAAAGDGLQLSFRRRGSDGRWDEAYVATWAPATGWTEP